VQIAQESVHNDPNSHSYMQSSVMSYSNTGQGAPKVFQATSATRQAPGGVGYVMCCFMAQPVVSCSTVLCLCKADSLLIVVGHQCGYYSNS